MTVLACPRRPARTPTCARIHRRRSGHRPGTRPRQGHRAAGPPRCVPSLTEAPSQGGAPDAPPPASMVRATHPHPKRPGAARSRFALVNWRVRWRLAAVIAVPTLTAAVLGALTINSDVNQWQATGRVQHLAQLNGDVVKFSQALEDELNVSAAFAATRPEQRRLRGAAEAGAERHGQRRQRRPQRLLRHHRRAPGTSRAPCRTSTRSGRASTTWRTSAPASPSRSSPRRRSSGSTAGTSSRPRTRSAAPSVPAPTTPTCRATSPRWAPCCGTRTRWRCSGPSSTPRSSRLRGRSARRISPPSSRPTSRRSPTWPTSTPRPTRPSSSSTATPSAVPRWTSRPRTRSWPSRWPPPRRTSRSAPS